MFQKIAEHRANDASNDVHRPPLRGARVKYEVCTDNPSRALQKFPWNHISGMWLYPGYLGNLQVPNINSWLMMWV